MNRLTLSGQGGQVYVGSRLACRLGAWTVTGDTVTAAILDRDPVWGSRPATELRLELGPRKSWRWPIEGAADAGTYRVHGLPEVR